MMKCVSANKMQKVEAVTVLMLFVILYFCELTVCECRSV